MATHLANEAQLVAAAQSGDQEAFGILVTSCYRPTFQMVVGITRNREDAEDVLQEAMLKAFCNLKQFQGNSQFHTWFFRIAVNEAVMKIRKRNSVREVVLDELGEIEIGTLERKLKDWSIHPEERYAQLEFAEILDNALAKLSPRLCTAFYLRTVEELSLRETAAMLGLSSDGVKTRVSRARSRLRKRLHSILRSAKGYRPKPQPVPPPAPPSQFGNDLRQNSEVVFQ